MNQEQKNLLLRFMYWFDKLDPFWKGYYGRLKKEAILKFEKQDENFPTLDDSLVEKMPDYKRKTEGPSQKNPDHGG